MILSYLKIAYRNLRKNPLISFINIFGLGLSMSVVMMELIIVQYETDYDRFHPHPDRTYRVTSAYEQKNGNHWQMASTPFPLLNSLIADSSVIEQGVNIYPVLNGQALVAGKEFSMKGAFTEPSFFKVFGFTLQYGNPGTALQNPGSIVITQTAAQKFFGTENPIGQSIDMQKMGTYLVTGVLQEAPGKSHISFEAYASSSTLPLLEKSKALPEKLNEWGDFRTAYTYITLKKGTGTNRLKGQLESISAGFNKQDKQGRSSFNLQPIEKVRPADSRIYNDIGGGTSWTKLWTGIYVSLIILFAACFNYTNLTIARALTRAKEVGLRKIVGARRYQIFVQYTVEAVLMALLSLGLGWVLLSFILQYAPFNDGYEMIPSAWNANSSYIIYTIVFAILTGLVAGVMPAWILSAFSPLRVLKNMSTARLFGKIGLQKTLIVFQYSLSLVIIIFLFTFYRQFDFLGSTNPGFRKDNVVVVPLQGQDAQLVSNKLISVNGVQSVSKLSVAFKPHFSGMSGMVSADNQQKDPVRLNYFFTDPSFIPSMELALAAGRNFDAQQSAGNEKDIIVNTVAALRLGFKSIDKAVGAKLMMDDSTSLTIIGVVKDFKYENAGKDVDPMAFRIKKDAYNYLYIVAADPDKTAMLKRVEKAWLTVNSKKEFTGSWLNKDLEQNNSQSATISLLGYLAFIALSIATLGLLGLVIYTVETKRKEIGVRKVIGASNKQLIYILSKNYVRLLIIAGIIAVPLGYTLSFLFLQNFVERVGYGLFGAIACFLFLLFVGLITILSQTSKAVMENPVKSLRTE